MDNFSKKLINHVFMRPVLWHSKRCYKDDIDGQRKAWKQVAIALNVDEKCAEKSWSQLIALYSEERYKVLHVIPVYEPYERIYSSMDFLKQHIEIPEAQAESSSATNQAEKAISDSDDDSMISGIIDDGDLEQIDFSKFRRPVLSSTSVSTACDSPSAKVSDSPADPENKDKTLNERSPAKDENCSVKQESSVTNESGNLNTSPPFNEEAYIQFFKFLSAEVKGCPPQQFIQLQQEMLEVYCDILKKREQN